MFEDVELVFVFVEKGTSFAGFSMSCTKTNLDIWKVYEN